MQKGGNVTKIVKKKQNKKDRAKETNIEYKCILALLAAKSGNVIIAPNGCYGDVKFKSPA